jgi:hypothetical protein
MCFTTRVRGWGATWACWAMRAEAERLERPLEVLELMAGAGLRTKRYLLEAPVAPDGGQRRELHQFRCAARACGR